MALESMYGPLLHKMYQGYYLYVFAITSDYGTKHFVAVLYFPNIICTCPSHHENFTHYSLPSPFPPASLSVRRNYVNCFDWSTWHNIRIYRRLPMQSCPLNLENRYFSTLS